MNILFITHKFYPFVGGIEVNSEILATHFASFGAQVILVTTTAKENSNDEKYPFKVVRQPGKRQLVHLHRWADVIYENNPTLTLSWPLLAYQRKKHVVAVRTWISRIDGSYSYQDRLKKWWLKRADAVIAVSEAIRKESRGDAVVIGNPYRSHLFKKQDANHRNKDFVFLGRLVSDKGVDMAVRLINSLNQTFPSEAYSLTIIGDGPEKNNLKKLVKSLALGNQVNFKGVLRGEELVHELNRHRFLLAPSRWREPFGNIALEGMACGCIPIVSDGGGLVDAVGQAGIVFKRNDLESLTDKVTALLKDHPRQNNLLQESDEHLTKHQPDAVAKRYYEVLANTF